MKQQENKAKFRLLEQISEKRQRTEILRLSVLMIGREKSFMDGHEKGAKKRTMEQEIRTLEQHKCVIQEQIASRTQEMVLRIMNRSGDRSQKPSAPDAARPKTETHELRTSILKNEMNKSAVALSVKDRLGIGKRQDTVSSAALSIRDRLGISKKQLNVILTPSIPSLICEDRAKESNTSLAPSAKDDLTEFARETIARRSSSPRDAAESLETCSNGISVASEEVAQNNETCNELLAQTSLSPPPLVMLNADPGFTEGTTVIPSRPPPLKAILKPPSSLTNQSEMSMRKDIPSPIFTSPSRFEDERSLIVNTTTDSHSAAFQPSVTQSTAVHPEHVSSGVNVDGERTRDSHLQPDDEGSENVTDAPAPKKPRVSQMPPPRPIPASQRQQTAKRPNQPPKRVSFMPNKEETREKEPRLGKGLNTQQATLSNAATQPAVEVEMESGESSQKQTEPAVSDFVEPVDVPVNRESTPKLPSTSQKENQACQSTADEFRHLFSPSPQMFSAPQQQATPGNFDSIFGAIFNTPDSSKDSAGFQFNLQGDTQKPNSTSTDTTNPSSSTGQDFFSFFGTPSNANETKKSYTDNFFKLF